MFESTSFFMRYSRDLFAADVEIASTLKEHPDLPLIIDTLSRYENHHVQLIGPVSEKIKLALLESIAVQLSEGHAPKLLRDIDFIFVDVKRLLRSKENPDHVTQTFLTFQNELQITNKRIIFAVNYFSTADYFSDLVASVLALPNWHVIILTNDIHSDFSVIKISDPNDALLINFFKTYKNRLETTHHVLIPEETFAAALSMSAHYLTSHANFDKALELLDSAAARASATDYPDPTGHFKPIVTSATLAQVISSWTHIPVSHLHGNPFQAAKFNEAVQRHVFGQDAAMTIIGSALQHACIKLQEKQGPLASFLLVGPEEVGKKTTAFAIAEHLFGHSNALIQVNLNDFESYQSVADIKIFSEDRDNTHLLGAIQQTPYAVILIEDIQLLPAATLALFKNILAQGIAFDNEGNKYDFRHAIIIITTTLGADRIASLMQTPTMHETNKTLDLMQLVLNDLPKDNTTPLHHTLSSQELCEELMPTLENYFATIIQHLTIVPFVPLDYAALEKIMRLKLKSFVKRLETQFGIELNYAPEVIKFLAHESLWRTPVTKSLEKIIERHLYPVVANEIIGAAEDKNRPKRMMLQLNDTGQLLRCEFVHSHSTMNFHL